MTQDADAHFFLIVIVIALRAAYAALVLGLGAMDAQSVSQTALEQSAIQYGSAADPLVP
jgi:hypothetical protein